MLLYQSQVPLCLVLQKKYDKKTKQDLSKVVPAAVNGLAWIPAVSKAISVSVSPNTLTASDPAMGTAVTGSNMMNVTDTLYGKWIM